MALVVTQFNVQAVVAHLSRATGSSASISIVATASPGTTLNAQDYNAQGMSLLDVLYVVGQLQLTNTTAAAVLVTLQQATATPPGGAAASYATIGTVRLGATGTAFDQYQQPIAFTYTQPPSYGTITLAAFAGTTAVVNAVVSDVHVYATVQGAV